MKNKRIEIILIHNRDDQIIVLSTELHFFEIFRIHQFFNSFDTLFKIADWFICIFHEDQVYSQCVRQYFA
jgi:hypothetical protein